MKLGYAIMLSNEVHNFVRKIQLELHHEVGTSLSRQPPHITIKSPFDCDSIEPHILYLKALSSQLKSFDIELQGFDSFGEAVLFLNVVPSDALINLHHQILENVTTKFDLKPHEFEGENIRFHASITGFHNSELFEKGKEYIKQYSPQFKFRLKNLGLFYDLGEGNGWIVNSLYEVK